MENFDLERFVLAQKSHFDTALSEIKAGRKQSHWIWYIFPQAPVSEYLSVTSRYYAIPDLDAAKAFLDHPYLGNNLRIITQALLDLDENDPYKVMGGHPDPLKLQSCMTLFEAAAPEEAIFPRVLDKYYTGQRNIATLKYLNII